MLAESAATAADGTVSFDNLMTIADNKQEYTIKEVEVPAGYLPNMLFTSALNFQVEFSFYAAVPNALKTQMRKV